MHRCNPFTNFWLDDNYLARYASETYNKPLPDGLTDYSDFTRWRILGGYDPNWYPYCQDYMDTLALDGLYYLSVDNVAEAQSCWSRIAEKVNTTMTMIHSNVCILVFQRITIWHYFVF